MTVYQKLRRLAEQAIGNGKWRDENTRTNAQMDYMAAVFDPAAILSLLDRLERAEKIVLEIDTVAEQRVAALEEGLRELLRATSDYEEIRGGVAEAGDWDAIHERNARWQRWQDARKAGRQLLPDPLALLQASAQATPSGNASEGSD